MHKLLSFVALLAVVFAAPAPEPEPSLAGAVVYKAPLAYSAPLAYPAYHALPAAPLTYGAPYYAYNGAYNAAYPAPFAYSKIY